MYLKFQTTPITPIFMDQLINSNSEKIFIIVQRFINSQDFTERKEVEYGSLDQLI